MMKFRELELPNVWLLESELLIDDRGVFRRSFCAEEFKQHGLVPTVLQGNISENEKCGTLRGFHYQNSPHQEAKTLTCLSGSLFDIVVDLRPNSPKFLSWLSVNLDAENRLSLYLPPGCANAYLTTNDKTIVHYYMSEIFVPDSYRGFHFADPRFSFDWPFEPSVISMRDSNLPELDVEKVRRESSA